MMNRRFIHSVLAATLVFLVAVEAPAWAQVNPDFSGTWMFAPAKSVGTPTVPRIFNATGAKPVDPNLVITQTPTELRVVLGGVQMLYKLDGTETSTSADGRAGFPVAKAMWDAGKLVIATTQEVFSAVKGNYVPIKGKEVYSLDGGVLTIEKTDTGLDGTTTSRKLVYTKGTASS